MDEAGRGPLAGPVVAAAVILPCSWAKTGLPPELMGLNDSKQVKEVQREAFFTFLTHCPGVEYGIAEVGPAEIDRINILQATTQAMNLAMEQLNPRPPHALVDGKPVKSLRVPQTAIIKGDARSFSIAAASILAKVTRDRLMLDWAKKYPAYGFEVHKGYGTAKHLAAITQNGPCPIHRHSFAPLKPAEKELF